MDVNNINEVRVFARDKAFQRLTMLKMEARGIREDLKDDSYLDLSQETLESMYQSIKEEIAAWETITKFAVQFKAAVHYLVSTPM